MAASGRPLTVPGEIAAALRSHPRTPDDKIKGRPGRPGGRPQGDAAGPMVGGNGGNRRASLELSRRFRVGHRPPCLGLVWSIKVIAYLSGEEMDFV